MNDIIEKLACKIGEGFQASVLGGHTSKLNVFHRAVTIHESSDLSFVSGLVSTGLRGSASLNGDKLIGNYEQLLTASRQHTPLVVNTSAILANDTTHSALDNYGNINAIQQTGCFQLIATSAQEEVFLTIIAHRISELSLIPGIVIADYSDKESKIELPSDNLIIQYLGNPDDQIECPTPAQEMIFGPTRRRIPNWYSLDVPVMLGSKKDGEAISFEAAASQKYFYEHLPQLIEQAYQEFKNVFGAVIKPISSKGNSSEYAIISFGGQITELFGENNKVELISLNQLNPFPAEALSELIKGKKAITLLENTSSSTNSPFYFKVMNALNGSGIKVYSGKYSSDLTPTTLGKAIGHMISNQPKMNYYLGLEFTKASSSYPKHDILLKEISKQYPDITDSTLNSIDEPANTPGKLSEVPLAVRKYNDKGPNYSRLSRFYDNTAFFYEHNDHSELVADPFAAIPVSPSASSSFFTQTSTREFIPVIDLKKNTGDGESFVHCPHSALRPIVIGVEQLMKSGIDIAASKGGLFTKLTPMLKNLSKVAGKSIGDKNVSKVQDFLPEAFDSLTTQMGLKNEKLEAAQSEFNAVLSEIGAMPVGITDTFFNTPTSIEAGSGELFSLTVDPASCTGCGTCAHVCDSINMESQTDQNLAEMNEQFKLWERLPDTSGATINRLFNDDNYSSLAAMMLSRSYFMSMSGASTTESDNPYKTLLHIVTATTESVVQPKIISQLCKIDELVESLSENVHNTLSKSLPKENLDQLSIALRKAEGRKLTFKEVVDQSASQEAAKLIDTKTLSRKTDLVDSLKNLKWALSEGPTGVGRSRYGMLIAGANSMDWAKQYPANNFTNPSVIHWNGSAPEQTLGLFHGQLRYLIDNIKLMRRAELESKDKYDPTLHDLEIANLNWSDLSDDEKKIIPPILLIAERDDLNESAWSSLNKLLAENYPVKVFLFDHIASPNHRPVASLNQTMSGMISSIALKNAFVYQGGMGNVDHLFKGLMDGLDKTSPALFNLYATKIEKHGVTSIDWSPYASLALNSRAFPSISFDPTESANFFGANINLDGNRNYSENWVKEQVALSEEETLGYYITWADWAYTQTNWDDEFTHIKEDDSNLAIVDYIQLDAKSRRGKIPIIMRNHESGLKYFSVSNKVVEMTEAVLANWNTLQELAGVIAEIPTHLKEELIKEMNAKHEEEIAALKKDYEQQLQEKEDNQTEILRQQLKNKLVALSNMAKN